jgi:hypothetical protein
MAFHDAVAAMAESAKDDLVGLVVRFNSNDNHVATLWSEGSRSACGPGNPDAASRPTMFRLNDDNQPRKGIRSALAIGDQAGYHAEELLIACWSRILGEFFVAESDLTRVEMVLSKSPCFGERGSSPLIISLQDLYHIRYGMGCSRKLYQFIRAKSRAIRWNIYYIALAGAKAGDYTWIGYSGHRGLMTREELDLDMWRRLRVWYRDNIREDMLSFADFYARLATAGEEEMTAIQGTLQTKPPNKAELGKQLGVIKKQVGKDKGQADTIRSKVEAKMKDFFDNARLQSLYNAQRGISLLQSLVNVDVARWST